MSQSSRSFRGWAYLLVLAPLLTDWLEIGHLPSRPREYITELVIGIIVAIFITLIYRDMRRLRSIAETDSLTGVHNRRRFMNDLVHEVECAHRLGTDLSLVYVDVNDFKSINDTFGHPAGDSVLRHVARLLLSCARRQVDACYRLGGDEFALLLVGVTTEGAADVMQRLKSGNELSHPDLRHYGVTLSCGTAQLRPGESTRDFLRRADAQMYAAKRNDIQQRPRPHPRASYDPIGIHLSEESQRLLRPAYLRSVRMVSEADRLYDRQGST